MPTFDSLLQNVTRERWRREPKESGEVSVDDGGTTVISTHGRRHLQNIPMSLQRAYHVNTKLIQ